jgi:hypothetical protein
MNLTAVSACEAALIAQWIHGITSMSERPSGNAYRSEGGSSCLSLMQMLCRKRR